MAVVNKTLTFEVREIGDPADRTLRFIGSTETEDRDGDIIEAAGWELDNYKSNPVFLFAHDYRQLPIGQALKVWVDKNEKKLMFDIKFATKDEYEFADTVYRLYLGGFMRATSVGFIGKEWDDRYEQISEGRSRWAGRTYKKQELLELSAVPVPCNPTALITARSKGLINSEFEKFFERGSNLVDPIPPLPDDKSVIVDLSQFLETNKSVKQFIRDDLKAKGRELLEQCGGIIVDYDAEVLLILDDTEEVKLMTFELLKSLQESELKAGAALSKKNKAALQQAHDLIKGVLSSAEPESEEEPEDQPEDETDEEEKGQKDAGVLEGDEIDLESIVIEVVPTEEKDIEIDPDMIATAIREVVQEELKTRGARTA